MVLNEEVGSNFGETLSMNTRVALGSSCLVSCDLRLPSLEKSPFKIVLNLDFPLVLYLVGNPDELTKLGRSETGNSIEQWLDQA